MYKYTSLTNPVAVAVLFTIRSYTKHFYNFYCGRIRQAVPQFYSLVEYGKLWLTKRTTLEICTIQLFSKTNH